MALAATNVLEVRAGGASTNGGGFNPANASPGTDFSQQAAAQFTYTDMVIAGSTVTSAGFPFTTALHGNLLNITGGVNFTPGRYEVVSVSGSTATLDRSPGTNGSTGGQAKLGGALNSMATAAAAVVAGNTVYVQGPTYNTNSQYVLSTAGGDGTPITWIGYTTARSDQGRPLITAGANLSPMVALSGANQIFKNFELDGANIADRGLDISSFCYLENVKTTRCNFSGIRAQGDGIDLNRCLATACGAGAGADGVGINLSQGANAFDCEANGNTNGMGTANTDGTFHHCISHNNTLAGFYSFGSNGIRLINCVADLNTGDGLRYTSTNAINATLVRNCLFTNNGGYGINSLNTDYSTNAAAQWAAVFQSNGFFNNTLGVRRQVPAGASPITLTATPYTNAAGGDYSLNGTTGGGALCRGTGVPGGFGLIGTGTLGSTGYVDVGAVQGLSSAPASTTQATLRSLWRELTNERDTAVVPDATVDVYLNRGLEALNRLIRYHWTTDSTSIVLVAGTQEYSIPQDCIDVEWIEWGGKELEKESMDLWRRGTDPWRTEQGGAPRAWALYGQKLIFRPAPDAAAVAKQASPIIRYVSKPDDFTASGPLQVSSQDWPVMVYYGAALWSVCHPESALSASRAKDLMDLFNAEGERIKGDYSQREVKG